MVRSTSPARRSSKAASAFLTNSSRGLRLVDHRHVVYPWQVACTVSSWNLVRKRPCPKSLPSAGPATVRGLALNSRGGSPIAET